MHRADGALLWSLAKDCGSGCDERGHALALDGAGDVYLAGSVDRGNWLLAKADATGAEQLAGWDKSLQPEGLEGEALDAAWIGDALVVVGTSGDHSLVRGYTADGSDAPTWSKRIDAPDGATVIDADGRVLSPGFIDLHAHLTAALPREHGRLHPWVVGAAAGDMARFYLDRGFTTIRDVAHIMSEGTTPRMFQHDSVISGTSAS